MASTTATPTATATAISATVTTAVSASVTVTATAKILAGTIVAAGGIVLRGVVMGREVLGRGSVRIRLPFLGCFGVRIFEGSGRNFVLMLLDGLASSGVHLILGRVMLFFVMFRGPGQGFAGEQFDRGTVGGRHGGQRRLRRFVRMAVIVVLEVLENVTDVEEGVAVKTNIHESRLHAGEDAGDFSLVDAADERELFFPLDVNFD